MSLFRVLKKFGTILSKHQKFRVFELIILMIIGGFLEMASVSLVFPLMSAVTNADDTLNSKYIKFVCSLIGINDSKTMVLFLALFLALIYLLKNAFLLFEYNCQYRFVYNNMFFMKKQLLYSFVNRPYEFFLHSSTGELMRIINTDTTQTFALLTTVLNMLTETVVSLCLIVTTFVIAPLITLIMAGVLLILLTLIQLFIKPILTKAGNEYKSSLAGENKWLLQTLEGIKEIKTSREEEYFEDNYDKYGKVEINCARKNVLLQVVPRFLIEAVCMSSMLIAVGVLIYIGWNPKDLLPMLSAVAMAAVRLLPSVNRIAVAFSSISFQEPMLDSLLESLNSMNFNGKESFLNANKEDDALLAGEKSKKRISAIKDTISVNDVVYSYPNSKETVLNMASLKVEKGTSVGIVGDSGSGKTTLVDVMLGLLKPSRGEVSIDGIDIQDDASGWLGQIGYIPQTIFMIDDTIRENVIFGYPREGYSDELVWKALDEASLGDFVRSLPEGLDTKIGERGVRISGGQRQRIGIARALYREPDILFFDEATSALDNSTESAIMESINSLKGTKTMVIIAHRLTTIEACDHVYRVADGKIEKER